MKKKSANFFDAKNGIRAGGVTEFKASTLTIAAVTGTFTYDPPAGPTIASINPNHGPIAGNTSVTITGLNFEPQVNVKFLHVHHVITQKSATQIIVNSPASTGGAVQLKVKNPNVAAVTGTFTYDPPPA